MLGNFAFLSKYYGDSFSMTFGACAVKSLKKCLSVFGMKNSNCFWKGFFLNAICGAPPSLVSCLKI